MAKIEAGEVSGNNMNDWIEKWCQQHVLRDIFKTMLKSQTDPAPSGQVVNIVANKIAKAIVFGK